MTVTTRAARPPGTLGRVSGAAPERHSYGSFAVCRDRDGSGWLLQEITRHLLVDEEEERESLMTTTYESVSDLAEALRRAAAAHGEHEKRIGKVDPDWPDWYALYMVKERAGEELPT